MILIEKSKLLDNLRKEISESEYMKNTKFEDVNISIRMSSENAKLLSAQTVQDAEKTGFVISKEEKGQDYEFIKYTSMGGFSIVVNYDDTLIDRDNCAEVIIQYL